MSRCINLYDEPNRILSDNGPQFREQYEKWCNRSGRDIEVIHAPPFHPQCKGKIERCISSFNEEYLRTNRIIDYISSYE